MRTEQGNLYLMVAIDRTSKFAFVEVHEKATQRVAANFLNPWTNGQVERMNRTLKEATVKRFYYETHEHFRQHLTDFVSAYNFARRLKTLKGLTPYEYICSIWTNEP